MVESRLVRTAWAALSSMVIHSGCGDDEDGEMLAAEVLPEERTQDWVLRSQRGGPERRTDVQRGWPREPLVRGLIGTHGVNGYVDRHQEKI